MSINITNDAIQLNVTGFVGDTLDNWNIKFVKDGAPYDISGIDFYYVVKKNYQVDDTDAIIAKGPADAVKTASSTVVDTVRFPLTPTETDIAPGKYVHAIKINNGGDERTYVEGRLELIQRRITTI